MKTGIFYDFRGLKEQKFNLQWISKGVKTKVKHKDGKEKCGSMVPKRMKKWNLKWA